MPLRLTALLLLAGLAACATPTVPTTPPTTGDGQNPVLLVSLDGVHPDQLFQGNSPTLDALAQAGVRAQWMNPSYPSLTFPNHYTLVTGLRPDRHGIIDNTMNDPELGGFWLSNRDAVGDGRWWDDGEPIWNTARDHGLRSGTMFWPGSEADINGTHPHYWLDFDGSLPKADRVAQVLAWLDLPAHERPHLLTLYFEHVDSAGHRIGPEGDEVDQAMREVDAALAQLLDGLEQRGLRQSINLVITSDHGMAATHPDRVMFVEDFVPAGSASIITIGSALGMNPREGREAELEAAVIGRHERFECWRREDMPERWAFGHHPRVPEIMCQADVGWRFVSLERAARRPGGWEAGFNLGSHGYDPVDPTMRAIFVAQGPDLVEATVIDAFDNIHVHPLLAALLGIPVPDGIDGDPAVLAPVLRGDGR